MAPATLGEVAARNAAANAAPRTVPLDLRPLLVPYREHKRFTLRIENLPQLARFSAGQNKGDNTWSLALDELEDLSYFPPKGFDKEHTLSVRLITKDETGASTIALIDFRVPSADGNTAIAPLVGIAANIPMDMPQHSALREEISQLKAVIAEREAELNRIQATGDQGNARWQQKFELALADAENAWKNEEALRLTALKATLEEQFEHQVAEAQARALADANAASERDSLALRNAQQELAAVKDAVASRAAELVRFQDKLERLRWATEAEISTARENAERVTAERLRAAEAQWQEQAAGSLADLTARCQAAEAALASAGAAHTGEQNAELLQLQDQLDRLRQQSQAEISAAREIAEREAAERLQVAQTQWQQQAAGPLAELDARCQAAEAALVSARAANMAEQNTQLFQLQDELVRLRQQSQADISAAREIAEREAAERLQAAQAQWQEQAAGPLAELTARCNAAEARAADMAGNAQLFQLQDELVRLRQQSQADIAAAREAAEKQAAGPLAELAARCEAAEAALVSARAADAADRNTQLYQLQDELFRARQQSQLDISAAKEAADRQATENLQAAQLQWQEQAAGPLAELAARCQAAEEALVSARAADIAERNAERVQLQDQLERLVRKSQADIFAAREIAEQEAAERLRAAQAEWQERAAVPLAEITARCQAAETALASARAAALLANRDAELFQLQDEMERLRQKSQADISEVRMAAEHQATEKLRMAEAEWRDRAAGSLSEITARCQAAEAALAAAQAAVTPANREAELAQLHAQLERLRWNSENEVAAAVEAAEQRAAERLTAAQTQWREEAGITLAEVTTRCHAAEAALTSVRAADAAANRDAELIRLQDDVERLRQKSQADVAAAREAAEFAAAEKLKAAEAAWREEAARSLAEVAARCQAAESALVSAVAASAGTSEADAYVRSLNLEIRSLHKVLVDREADLARAHAAMEQMRLGIMPDVPVPVLESPGMRWKPLSNRDLEEPKKESHLFRDVAVIFVLVIGAILAMPRLESMLPDNIRWQVTTLGGFLDTAGPAPAPIAAPAPLPPAPQPKTTTVTRAVNMRAQPALGAPVLASLNKDAKVIVLETKGNWVRVQISGGAGKDLQGWVYGSYVGQGAATPAAANDASAPEVKPASEAPVSAITPVRETPVPQAAPVSEPSAPQPMPASEASAPQTMSASESAAAPAILSGEAVTPQAAPAP